MWAIFLISLKENVERKKRSLDYIGTLSLTGAIVALLFALLQGGTSWAWNSLPSITLFILSVLLLVLFFYQEQRALEPILPLTLFNNRIIAISSIGGVILGVIMFGAPSFVPLFVQGVKGGTATSAGISLGPMLIAWPIAAALSGRIILRYGYRFTALYNSGDGDNRCRTWPHEYGLHNSGANAVPWNLRGVATASTQFFRTIGGTIGVAVMGTILNAQMALRFTPLFARYPDVVARLPKAIAPSNVLLTPAVRETLPAGLLSQLQAALAQSLFWVFALMFMLALIGLATMFLLPGGQAEQYAYKGEEKAEPETIGLKPEITTVG